MKLRGVVSASLAPNLEVRDVLRSLQLLFTPWKLKEGTQVEKVESWFKREFLCSDARSFASGREAEYAILVAAGIKKGDEVLVQAFTCIAVIQPILAIGAIPVYVDISQDTFSMDPDDLKRKITSHARAVILQHTFGIPGDVERMRKITKEAGLILIEDCAHIIGGGYKKKKLGMWGDAAFFSFGRDKSVSSVFGGIAITNSKEIALSLEKIHKRSRAPSYSWIYQQLFYSPIMYLVLSAFALYPFLGKILLYFTKKTGIFVHPVRFNLLNFRHVRKYPCALASLLIPQLEELERLNSRRLAIYTLYKKKLQGKAIHFSRQDVYYLRIPLRVEKRDALLSFCKRENIYLGDWYSHVGDPGGVDILALGYKRGMCMVAEEVSSQIVNLPCYPGMTNDEVEKVIRVVKSY